MSFETLLPKAQSLCSVEELMKITENANGYIEYKEALAQHYSEACEEAATVVMMLRFFGSDD